MRYRPSLPLRWRAWSAASCSRPALAAPQRVQPSPVALGRPLREVSSQRLRQPPLVAPLLALGDRLRRLLVEFGGRARRPAPLGEPGDDDREPLLSAPDLEPVAVLDVPCGLHALAVDVHVPAGHGLGRGAAGLEKPRRPE